MGFTLSYCQTCQSYQSAEFELVLFLNVCKHSKNVIKFKFQKIASQISFFTSQTFMQKVSILAGGTGSLFYIA